MSFDGLSGGGGGSGASVDPQLARFVQEETQKQQFQTMVHGMADSCWDMCLGDKMPSKMDGKTDTCLNNCVNRLIDASQFLIQRLQETRNQGSGFS